MGREIKAHANIQGRFFLFLKPLECLGAPSFIRFLLPRPKRQHKMAAEPQTPEALLLPLIFFLTPIRTQATRTQDVKLPLALPAGQGFDLTKKELC